ncbi:MAG TPA: monovalent cation/H+ antiporter complex subunit F [Segeticoccus sp.]|uniref:monovalent cation/H+ antiporter complex subunit F n=1 Tax=Segeticoccus sp. TaxID=2706531 RepID=UPI002D7EAE6C|nr:monovalent cation/H+ antiporter complex subunit F [Segeticoccus sp.]HET8598959.1 monovalent cation/H+ antiporter complex subunit F [Segeticoccus sp.]
MNPWLVAGLVLSLLLAPAGLLASRGDPMERLVGMELAGGILVLDLLALSQAFAQSSYLIVPLVLVLLSFAGTLVFTRLLGPRP